MSIETQQQLENAVNQVLIDIHKLKVKEMMTESDYEGVEAKRHFGSTRPQQPEEDRRDSEIQRVLTNLEKEIAVLSEVMNHLSSKLDSVLTEPFPRNKPEDEVSISPETQLGAAIQEKANQIESLRTHLQELHMRVAL